jgi:hypothetical protein
MSVLVGVRNAAGESVNDYVMRVLSRDDATRQVRVLVMYVMWYSPSGLKFIREQPKLGWPRAALAADDNSVYARFSDDAAFDEAPPDTVMAVTAARLGDRVRLDNPTIVARVEGANEFTTFAVDYMRRLHLSADAAGRDLRLTVQERQRLTSALSPTPLPRQPPDRQLSPQPAPVDQRTRSRAVSPVESIPSPPASPAEAAPQNVVVSISADDWVAGPFRARIVYRVVNFRYVEEANNQEYDVTFDQSVVPADIQDNEVLVTEFQATVVGNTITATGAVRLSTLAGANQDAREIYDVTMLDAIMQAEGRVHADNDAYDQRVFQRYKEQCLAMGRALSDAAILEIIQEHRNKKRKQKKPLRENQDVHDALAAHPRRVGPVRRWRFYSGDNRTEEFRLYIYRKPGAADPGIMVVDELRSEDSKGQGRAMWLFQRLGDLGEEEQARRVFAMYNDSIPFHDAYTQQVSPTLMQLARDKERAARENNTKPAFTEGMAHNIAAHLGMRVLEVPVRDITGYIHRYNHTTDLATKIATRINDFLDTPAAQRRSKLMALVKQRNSATQKNIEKSLTTRKASP